MKPRQEVKDQVEKEWAPSMDVVLYVLFSGLWWWVAITLLDIGEPILVWLDSMGNSEGVSWLVVLVLITGMGASAFIAGLLAKLIVRVFLAVQRQVRKYLAEKVN